MLIVLLIMCMAIGIGLGAPWYLVVLAGVSLLGFWTLVWFKMK